MALSANAKRIVECPFCKELIPKGAVRCSHCQSDLKPPVRVRKPPFLRGPFMLGVYVSTIFWIIFYIFYLSRM
jgi:hypothetical protein